MIIAKELWYAGKSFQKRKKDADRAAFGRRGMPFWN